MYQHATVSARYANQLYGRIVAGTATDEDLAHYRSQIDFLRSTLVTRDGPDGPFGVWQLPMPLPEFSVGAGWTSAFTNGYAAVALAQAAEIYSNEAEDLLEAMNLAVTSLSVDVANGGTATFDDDTMCFEEVGAPAEPTCILNGHIFALSAVRTLVDAGIIGDANLVEQGEQFIRDHLDDYDLQVTSLYHPTGKFAEPGGYNELHILQLLWLYDTTGWDTYFDTAARWLTAEEYGYVESLDASSSVDPTNHGPDRISDGANFYGYWSSGHFPTTVSFSVDATSSAVCGLAVYSLSESPPPVPTHIVSGSDQIALEEPVLTHDDGNTTLTIYDFPSCVAGPGAVSGLESDGIAVVFTTAPSGGLLALRELDLVSDFSNEAYRRLLELTPEFDRAFDTGGDATS